MFAMQCKGATMLLAFIVAYIASVAAKQNDIPCETCVKVDGICYNTSYVTKLAAPFRKTIVISKMGILRDENRLYFAFEPEISDPEYYKIGFVNLDKSEDSGIVTGSNPVNNFGTFDIDQRNKIVYVGGSGAICNLDADNKAVFFSSGGESIKSIFYKGRVFFVRDGENKIVEKKDSEFVTYEEYSNVKNFVIDKNNILVFLNSTGLYANKFKTNNTVYLSKNAFFRGLSIDLEGSVYTWWIDYIYKVVIDKDFEDSRLVKVAEIVGLGAVTFDNENNILFNSGKNLLRLSPANTTAC